MKKSRKKKENEEINLAETWNQLELVPLTPFETLQKNVCEYKESSDKVRRGIYAKHTALAKRITDLETQMQEMKHQLEVLTGFIDQKQKDKTKTSCESKENHHPNLVLIHTMKDDASFKKSEEEMEEMKVRDQIQEIMESIGICHSSQN